MNNQNVIDAIREQSSGILEQLADRSVREFRIKDLDIDNGVYLKDMPVRGKALSGIMSTLRVRNNFADFSNKMSPEDWVAVSQKLKNAEAETKLYAKIVKTDDGSEEIVDVYKHNPKKKVEDTASYSQYMNWIEESLGATERNYSLKGIHYDRRSETFDLTLLNENDRVDVFGTDQDLWKMGDRFIFNGLRFDYAPFFERLVCSNGNTALEYGFGANITHAKFNNNRIKGVIEKSLVFGSETLGEQLQKSVQHLKDNNVSLAEFNQFRRFFEGRNENEKYMGIIQKFFNDQPFYQAYGLNIAQKSRKWQSTANTGINAYDFFNMLTWIASHPDQVRVETRDRLDLQIQASNLLFKKELDLEDVASHVSVNYPRLAAMN